MPAMSDSRFKALTFDVFGTVVDWRTSVVAELTNFGERHALEADWVAFADSWRGLYQPAMTRVRNGERDWTILDDLHRESLETLLEQFNIAGLLAEDIDHLNRAWHRLDPWSDVLPGMTRLKREFILATLSNGNVALLVNMAKRAGLPWDAILGAELTRTYKRLPEAYLGTARFLGLEPTQCLMVAAHNDDLVAASKLGFGTAFVARPTEYGPSQTQDVKAQHKFNYVVDSFEELADMLGA
jgi:2-haloacid dehalogenase